MFKKNFNAEAVIKTWAMIIKYASFIITGLSFLGAIIVLVSVPEHLWWISPIVLGGGVILFFPMLFFSHLVWGFGDIVGNTKKTAYGKESESSDNDTILPEL